MRTTLTLDDRVYQYARSIAVLSGKGLGEVVSELALAGIEVGKSSSSPRAQPATLDQDSPAEVDVAALELALQELP